MTENSRDGQESAGPTMTAPLPVPDIREIYQSPHIHVRAAIFDPGAPVVVAFVPREATRVPFGMSFALKNRFNWVAVTCDDCDWLQYPDLPEAESAIRAAVAGFPRVITYGSSHGGHGALLCSGAIDADAVLALVPQSFIGGNSPNGEPRAPTEFARADEQFGNPHKMAPRVSRRAEIYVVYDPLYRPDRVHLEDLAAIRPVNRLYLPLCDHGALSDLGELRLSTALIRAVMAGTVDVAAFQKAIHAARHGPHQIRGLVRSLYRRNREPSRALYEKAVACGLATPPDLVAQMAARAAERGYADIATPLLTRVLDNPVALRQAGIQDRIRLCAASIGDPDLCDLWADRLWAAADTLLAQTTALSLPPMAAVWQIRLTAARVRTHSRHPERALEMVRLASVVLSAWDGAATRAFARAFEELGDSDTARLYRERLPRVDYPDFETFLQFAQAAEADRDPARVLAIWEEASALKVDALKIAPRLCKALMQVGRHQDALDALAPASAIARPGFDVLRMQATCLLQLGRSDEALAVLARASEVLPSSPVPWTLSCRALHGMHRYEEAVAHGRRALEIAPGDKAAQRELNRAEMLIARAGAGK